ncbi:MAG: ATP synthase F0 subunit B [Patescibacteria group bacterium]
MDQFISQLGIDWRLLLSQAVNFLIVLLVLRLFVYKPVLQVLHDRKTKIEEGIAKANEAERRLTEAEEVKKGKIHEAEIEVMGMFKEKDAHLKQLEEKRLAETERKAGEMMKNAELVMAQKKTEFDESLGAEAKALLRMAVEKVAALDPKTIDEALIERATREAMNPHT